MRRCLLDLDGILVDFVKGACRLHKRTNPFSEGCTEFMFGNHWDMPLHELLRGMDRFFWRNLPWTADGKAIFEVIDHDFGPKNTCILTSPSLVEGCFDGKTDWIQLNLPKAYHECFLIGPAKHFCARSDSVLIDDRDENIDAFQKAGGQGILIPRPWNRGRNVGISAVDFLIENINYGRAGIRIAG